MKHTAGFYKRSSLTSIILTFLVISTVIANSAIKGVEENSLHDSGLDTSIPVYLAHVIDIPISGTVQSEYGQWLVNLIKGVSWKILYKIFKPQLWQQLMEPSTISPDHFPLELILSTKIRE